MTAISPRPAEAGAEVAVLATTVTPPALGSMCRPVPPSTRISAARMVRLPWRGPAWRPVTMPGGKEIMMPPSREMATSIAPRSPAGMLNSIVVSRPARTGATLAINTATTGTPVTYADRPQTLSILAPRTRFLLPCPRGAGDSHGRAWKFRPHPGSVGQTQLKAVGTRSRRGGAISIDPGWPSGRMKLIQESGVRS